MLKHKTPYRVVAQGVLYCYLNGMRNEFYVDKHGVWWTRWKEKTLIPIWHTRIKHCRNTDVLVRVREMVMTPKFVKWQRMTSAPEPAILSDCRTERQKKRMIPFGEAYGPETYEHRVRSHV